jgi:hypothetical protein
MELIKRNCDCYLLPVATRINEHGKEEIGTISFKPNTLLKRCNKLYLVDANGTQKRVKE